MKKFLFVLLGACLVVAMGMAQDAPQPTPNVGAINTPKTETTSAYSDFSKYLLVIENDVARGTGFVARHDGVSSFFTNCHVLQGNVLPRVRHLSGQPIRVIPQTFFITAAESASDVVIFGKMDSADALEIMQNVESEASIGDEIVVLGNSLGANVVTEIYGKIVGIGPDLVEVDAKFVSGNSGSPVIHVKSSKVVGIASFSTLRRMDGFGKDSKFNNVERRFAYRLDNISKWRNFTWPSFLENSKKFAQIDKRTDALCTLARDVMETSTIKDWATQLDKGNPWWSNVQDFQKLLADTQKRSAADFVSVKKKLLHWVCVATESDMKIPPFTLTGFQRAELAEKLILRQKLREYFHGGERELQNDPYFRTR